MKGMMQFLQSYYHSGKPGHHVLNWVGKSLVWNVKKYVYHNVFYSCSIIALWDKQFMTSTSSTCMLSDDTYILYSAYTKAVKYYHWSRWDHLWNCPTWCHELICTSCHISTLYFIRIQSCTIALWDKQVETIMTSRLSTCMLSE